MAREVFGFSWAPKLTRSRVTTEFVEFCCRQSDEMNERKIERLEKYFERCWPVTSLLYPYAMDDGFMGACLARFSVACYDRCVLMPIQTVYLRY